METAPRLLLSRDYSQSYTTKVITVEKRRTIFNKVAEFL